MRDKITSNLLSDGDDAAKRLIMRGLTFCNVFIRADRRGPENQARSSRFCSSHQHANQCRAMVLILISDDHEQPAFKKQDTFYSLIQATEPTQLYRPPNSHT